MEGRKRGHGVGGEGPWAGRGGWVDLSPGGGGGGRWGGLGVWGGLRGELWGSWMTRDMTGHAGRIVAGGCLRGWLIRWRPSKTGRGV